MFRFDRRPILTASLSLALFSAGPSFIYAAHPVAEGDQSGADLAILPEGSALLAQNPLTAEPSLTTPVPPDVSASRSPTISQSVTVNLINRLVERGVLTKQDSAELLNLAEAEASEARAQSAAAQQEAIHTAVTDALAAARAAAPPSPPELPPPDDGTVRVTYIPEVVKAQMRDQIKEEVMAQARDEHWAAPNAVPAWVQKVRLFGDIRTRYQGDYFPDGNDNTGAFPNFNAINTGAPFDISGTVFAPQNNADQNRDRFRLRLRIGAEADLGQGFTFGLRVATGETNSPVTTNQTLGLANNAQGGFFSKYAIWLDRGFLKFELGAGTDRYLALVAGRFDNPFFSTEIAFDEDVGFDGVALLAKYGLGHGITPFLTIGAFPVFNTDFNFANTSPAKFKSTDKYLYAGQVGFDWNINHDFHFKLGGAYYYFDKVEGKLSDPFVPLSPSDQGNTDDRRPSFAQKGNTYMALRDIVPTAANDFGTIDQYQYYGLATPFHELALTARLDYTRFEPFKISLVGEYINNLAFDHAAVEKSAVNNRNDGAAGTVGSFAGSDTAWIVDLRAGHATLDKLGAWAVGVNYRYVGSDSVVDALTESDFGGGGTNLRGYSIYGVMGLSPRVSLGVKWMSARQIAGPPFKEDTLEVDLSGSF